MKPKVSYNAKSIYDIDPSFFLSLGVKAVVTDLDNTLDPAHSPEPSKRAVDLIAELKGIGLMVVILSNNNKERCDLYCKGLDVPYLYSSFKYAAFRIRKFLKGHNLAPEDCIFVGDQIFTDRIYTKKMKARLILTEPLVEKDQWVTKIPRFFDKRIRKKWREKGLLGESCPTRKD